MAPLIVFGYGSLVWNPMPHTVDKIPGYVKGFVRRFAQSSEDHRGTPERPGRVVTLVRTEDWEEATGEKTSDDNATVWGMGWVIDEDKRKEVKEYLDHREKDGYTEETVCIYNMKDGKEVVVAEETTMYVGKPNNPSFVGNEPRKELAERILSCKGDSGENKEYLYKLAQAVRDMEANHDEYLFDLEAAAKEIEKSS